MYAYSASLPKHNNFLKILLMIFMRTSSFIEILAIPAILGLEFSFTFYRGFLSSETPFHLTTKYYIILDCWYQKVYFLFYGTSRNECYLKDRTNINRLKHVRDQSGKKNTKKNISIRKEFTEYIEFVKSENYKEIICNSYFFSEKKLNQILQEFKLKENNIYTDNYNKLIVSDKITRNAIIEYEFYNKNRKVDKDNFRLWIEETKNYFQKKYPNRFKHLKKCDYEKIIYLILYTKSIKMKDKQITNYKMYNIQAQKIAEFTNNHEALKSLKERFNYLESLEI